MEKSKYKNAYFIRQVGKSYLLKTLFAEAYFSNYILLDFLENPSLAKIFSEQKTVSVIVKNIQIQMGVDYNPQTDLLILDEIGECQEAIDTLKYFSEQTPNAYVCASGSNIGLLKSYPVGKVLELKLTPMYFEEFLLAQNEPHVLKAYRSKLRNETIHQKLWTRLLEYNFVGGMPKAIDTWIQGDKKKMNLLISNVRKVQTNLLKGYVKDFGKISGNKKIAFQIETIFNNVPIQLAKEVDSSVKRYQFSNIIPKKNGYADFTDAIEFLVKCGLISKNYPIQGRPKSPLPALISKSRFKLFFFDIGLLNCMLEISYQEINEQSYNFKGYIAENYAQNEILSLGKKHSYSWRSARSAEIEFIIKRPSGGIIPIEIKSGKHTQAKSLNEYIKKYSPNLYFN